MEKKRKSNSSTEVSTLSATFEEVQNAVFTELHNAELKKGIDKYLKETKNDEDIKNRDLQILCSIIGEYLDSYILFGYNIENERVIVQSIKDPKEHDAMMSFMDMVYDKYHSGMGEEEDNE